MAPHSSIVAWRIPWTKEPGGQQVPGVAKSHTRLSDFTFTFIKKDDILPFAAACMDIEVIILNELSQTEKDK